MKIHLYSRNELIAYLSMYYPESSLAYYSNSQLLDMTNDRLELEEYQEQTQLEAELV